MSRHPPTSRNRLSAKRPPAGRLMLKREMLDLLGGKCIDCGYSEHMAALDFDHIDPSTKCTTVSELLSKATRDAVVAEVKKCEIRCANCHRIKTHPDATM